MILKVIKYRIKFNDNMVHRKFVQPNRGQQKTPFSQILSLSIRMIVNLKENNN